MTVADFRRIALGMREATESAHMGHPDFRVKGRIFATIHHDRQWAMVKLTPEDQQRFVRESPNVFKPENGAWGLQGCTAVRLGAADEELVGEAMTLAYRRAVAEVAARAKKARTRPNEKRRP